jgi:endonuclease V-like protein UPF0215 family
MSRGYANVIGIDDAPFSRNWRGDVWIVGAVFAGSRLGGVMCGRVRRDVVIATERLIRLIKESPFNQHIRLIMLQGARLAGFYVVDAFRLAEQLDRPVLIVDAGYRIWTVFARCCYHRCRAAAVSGLCWIDWGRWRRLPGCTCSGLD